MLGELFGSYRVDLMEDCRNEGSISGQCYVQVGALVGEARLNWQGAATVNTIKNCTNTGSINVTTMKGSDAGGTAFLVVGGLVVTRDGTWRLEGCSNTGSITTQVEAAGRTKNIYYVRTGSGTGGSLTADTPTETEQAKTEYISETVMP